MDKNEQRNNIQPDKSDAFVTASYAAGATGPGGQIGPYKILSILGEGGYGIVYLAEQQKPVRRRVALKVIKPGMDTKEVIARFEAERQALALLDHPNIAHVYDAGTTEIGRPYFVMEYVKGVPIIEHCDRQKLTIEERLVLSLEICEAIQHAHQKGIIHRDIKPSNILVLIEGKKSMPKVIDFGVAKAISQPLTERTLVTEQGQFIGTPEYMSPEQAEMTHQDIDTRSDIYSLGVVLYELLTGVLPFDAKTLREKGIDHIRRVIREEEPKTPSIRLTRLGEEARGIAERRHTDARTLAKQLHKELEWIPLKAMRKELSHRYQTASEFADDIRNYLNGSPLIAGPESVMYRFKKFARRHRVPVMAVAFVAAAVVVGFVVSTTMYFRAERARQQAEAQAYASDMSLAQQALAQNNLGRAEELLNRHRPKAGEKDLRGWEWRYLWKQCRSDASFTLCRQSSSIWSLAVSTDGKWVAIGEQGNGGLLVWDLVTRQEIARLEAGDGSVRVAFSPREKLLAFSAVTGSGSTNPQHKVRLWNGTTKQIVTEVSIGGECMGLSFYEDGQTLITYTANPENQVALWRVPTGTKLASYPVSQFNETTGTVATPFALARDRSVVAVAPDSTIHLIDLDTGKERWSKKAAEECVKALALSPDGTILASGAGFVESAIRLWDVATGKEITRLQGHRAWVSALVFWPDSKILASASADQTIRLWDLTDIANVPPPRILRGHKLEVWRLALLPDGKTLVSGSKDGSVYLWDTTTIHHEQTRIILPAAVATWRFAPDSKSVLTVDLQGCAVQWKGTNFQERESLMDISTKFSSYRWPFRYSVLISHDGRWVAAGSDDGTIRVWDLQERTLLHQSTVSTGWVVPLGFTKQGTRLVVFHASDGSFHEWELSAWQQTCSWQGFAKPPVVAFSPDERWCLMFSGEQLLRDTVTGRQINPHLEISDIDVTVFSPDGRLFAAASSLGYAKLWETSTLRELKKFEGFLMGVHSVSFSPDGKRLAIGSDGSEAVKLWEVESYQELLTLEGEGSLFGSTAFSPDGNVLAAMNAQGTLHLWRVPSWADIEEIEKNKSINR